MFYHNYTSFECQETDIKSVDEIDNHETLSSESDNDSKDGIDS